LLSLTGANIFAGATTINAGTLTVAATSGGALGATSAVTVNSTGTLLLGASDQINNSAGVTLAGGTFAKGDFSEGTSAVVGVGALTLTAAGSHLDFGTGTVGTLTFASFTPGLNTLVIDNWTGTANTVGSASTDRLIFNSDQALNLASFSFTGYAPGAIEFALGGGYFEITPLTAVPEPSTWIAGALAVVAMAYSQRRRILGNRRV
jgi:autotransporter-associated beta strand protein